MRVAVGRTPASAPDPRSGSAITTRRPTGASAAVRGTAPLAEWRRRRGGGGEPV